MTNSNKQQGFTLVELSIVLVIIGLLIGGILAAQSMINTTKIQATVRQIGQFDATVTNFKDKFGGLPGDVAAVGTAIGAGTNGDGDGDGIIEDTAGTLVNFSGEIGTFWNALSLTGLSTEGNGTGGITFVQAVAAADVIVNGSTANVPKTKLGSTTSGWVAHGSSAQNFYQTISTANAGSGVAWVSSTGSTSAFKPVDTLAIDTKMDDGVANAGNVQARSIVATLGSTALAAIAGTASCVVTGTLSAYNVTATGNGCDPIIRMGTTVGNPL